MGDVRKDSRLMLVFLKTPSLVILFSYQIIMIFLVMILVWWWPFCKCGQASDFLQQLWLTSELESDLRDIFELGWEVGCWIQYWENTMFLIHRLNNSGIVDAKMDGFMHDEKSSVQIFFISKNLPSGFEWNTIVISRLVLLIATWKYWISCKNGWEKPWVFSKGITLIDVHRDVLDGFHFLILLEDSLFILLGCMIFLVPFQVFLLVQ